jgi:anti-sigma factor RsiW
MRCHRVHRLLPDYIGDELSLKKREQVEQHLEHCAACKAALAALQGVWDRLARQTLPQQGEEFWQGFTARVMREVRRRRHVPAGKKAPLLFPGWKVLLPAAGAAAAVIAVVIALRGGPGPGQGPGVLPGERETVAEVVQPFSVAPLAAEEDDLFNGDEDLGGQLDTLNERELERFDRLLSARYSLS